MQLVAYRNTMAGARPKIAPAEPDFKPSLNLIEVRRQRAEMEIARRKRELVVCQAQIAKERQAADEAIRRANEALRELHAAWALEDKRGNSSAKCTRNLLTISEVLRRISKATGIHSADILSSRGNRSVILARQAVMYWAARRCGKSTPQIGRFLNRDHTSVLHGKAAYVEKRAAMGRHLRVVR